MGQHVMVDLRDIDRMVADLRQFAAKGIPFAARKSLNETAFEARKRWVDKIEKTFTLRNKFTVRQVRVLKATGSFGAGGLGSMHSEVGSYAPYMLMQEEGGTESPRRGHARGIPTSGAAGQAKGAARTKPVRPANFQPRIKLANQVRGRALSKKQRNAIAIRMALAKGKRFVLLETDSTKGIYSLRGRATKRRVRTTTRMVWNLAHRTQRVPPRPLLQSTLRELEDVIPGIHVAALLAQLRHHGIKGYEGG